VILCGTELKLPIGSSRTPRALSILSGIEHHQPNAHLMSKFNPLQNGFEWLENLENEAEPPLPAPLFAPRKRTASFQVDTKNSSGEHEQGAGSPTSGGLNRPVPIGRNRSTSDAMDYDFINEQSNYLDLIASNISSRVTEFLVEFFARILPPLKIRSFYFTVVIVILSLVIFGQASNNLSMNGVPPPEWYSFFLLVMLTDYGTCILDEFLFLLIDRFWLGAEEIRLYAHCLNGPLSFILTISIVNGTLSSQSVPQSIESWNPLMSTLITIWTFYTIRQFYLRMNLNKLMVKRFSSRIHTMQLDTKVLSLLSHAVPRRLGSMTAAKSQSTLSPADQTPTDSQQPHQQETQNHLPFDSHQKSVARHFFPELPTLPEKELLSTSTNTPAGGPPVDPPSQSEPKLSASVTSPSCIDQSTNSLNTSSDGSSEPDRSKAIDRLKKSAFTKHFSNFIHKNRESSETGEGGSGSGSRRGSRENKQSFADIFSEIVESSHRSGGDDNNLTADDSGIQQSFWSRLAEVSNGSLVINTANGKLIIRNKKHAISFGKRLYTLLSRGGQKKITSQRIVELLRRLVREESGADDSGGGGGGGGGSRTVGGPGVGGDSAYLKEIIERALALFHLPTSETDPEYDTTALSQAMVNDVCTSVYRSRRNIASSLSDFGELRKSLIAVTDVLVWIAMIIVAQMIVKVDLESVFAPVLTLIFAISFAVGPVVSNVFLSIGFVSFMLPFDVGDRVAIGTGPTRLVGNISRITLLRTTLTTLYNEKVPPLPCLPFLSCLVCPMIR
jgi:hypothetical protein